MKGRESMQKIKMSNPTNLTLNQAFEMYLKKCKVRNLSDKTILSYKQINKRFFDFCDPRKRLSTITEDTIDDYILWLRDEVRIKDVTINTYLRTLRAFLYYCMDCGYMESFKIQLCKIEKPIKQTYSDEELERLLEKPNLRKCTFAEYKTWVFENYLLATANRIRTALNVRICDVDFSSGFIVLRKTKNRKQQVIPLSESLSAILQEYLEIRGGEPEDYLFCNDYGKQSAVRTYQQLVHNYNIKHNVNKTSCHLFRHTFAKHWIINGGDIFRLQKIMGHSTLDMTKEYVTLFGNDLQIDFERFNPLDTIKHHEHEGTHISMKKGR